jgi:hypothetical protein
LCPYERAYQATDSPGPVGDDESLCRGIYENHVRGTQKTVVNSWIRVTELARDGVSVWRAKYLEDTQSIVSLLDKKGVKPLVKVVALHARELRTIRLPDGDRALCVVDDTVDGVDSRHRAHATLVSCREKHAGVLDVESAEFTQIQEDLRNLFQHNLIWSRAA